MSRRKIAVNNNYDILPIINDKREMTKALNQGVMAQNYYDLFEIDAESLFKKVEDRKRFKDVISLIENIRKVTAEKQGELSHIYIIEGENKQDLIISAYYICLQLEQYGFIEASKMIVVPSYNFINIGDSDFVPNNGRGLGMINSFKDMEADEDEEYTNPWHESSEAILSFVASINQLPSYESMNSIEQYPIFLLIDKSLCKSIGIQPADFNLQGDRGKDTLFEYIAAGAFHLQLSPLEGREFITLFRKYIEDKGYSIAKGVSIEDFIKAVTKKKKVLSEIDIKLLGDGVIANHLTRDSRSNTLIEKDFLYYVKNKEDKKEEKAVNPYEQLNSLIGLPSIKQQIQEMVMRLRFDKHRKEAGLSSCQIGFNAVFLGSPGTAKTTVARVIAEILKHEKFIDSASFKEVKKSDIVGKYVGWTAAQIDDMFNSLAEKGGVIFFDEIYTLSEDDSTTFDKEAITAIVQNMENNRNVFCVFAGYQDRMLQFLSKNPGLRSRISFTFKFEDYSSSELIDIFDAHAKQHSYILPEGYKEMAAKYFDYLKASRKDNFGNGREARTLFELSTVKMAARLSSNSKFSRNELMELKLSDIEDAIKTITNSELIEEVKEKRRIGF